jgi:integrase
LNPLLWGELAGAASVGGSHRPKKSGTATRQKQHVMTFRVTAEERRELETAALAAGLTFGSYICQSLLKIARTGKRRRPLADAAALPRLLGGDWIFASPLKLGRLPYSYTGFWRELHRAGEAAGLGHMSTHTFRHSYRMWIDAIGTPVGVQQKLMRHSDIRTTMNIYGDAASADMRQAHGKIVQMALRTI